MDAFGKFSGRDLKKGLMATPAQSADSLGVAMLSVVVIGAQAERRSVLARLVNGPQAKVVLELGTYPRADDLNRILDTECDVVIVDLDDIDAAVDLVEMISASDQSITVMVYGRPDPDVLVRLMRAGARELLNEPLQTGTVGLALVRAASRMQEGQRYKKTTGKLLVFAGVKGGSGVTTIATNFALGLQRESEAKVVLVDLNLQLGDAALMLGMKPQFSVLDALKNENRLDSDFLAALLTKHESGLHLLAAPDTVTLAELSPSGIDQTLRLLRATFDYVVVDAGVNWRDTYRGLTEAADSVYLVTQVSIVGLRNANRVISEFFPNRKGKAEIVLNRFEAKSDEIDEESVNKALTRPPDWKVPNDFASAAASQSTGIPLISQASPAARVILSMAQSACGKTPVPEKKKKILGLF